MSDIYSRSMELQNTMQEFAQREAAQRRTVAEAANRQLTQASDAVQDIVEEIDHFETQLKPNEEARIVIIGGPGGTTIFPHALASLGVDRIRFEGVDNDERRVTVIQHVSQLNLMLMAVSVQESQARRIGFHSLSEADET